MITINKPQFDKIVKDFEYGIIDSFAIGESIIEWQPLDGTCFEFVHGEIVSTGSFEHLLQWFLTQEAAE